MLTSQRKAPTATTGKTLPTGRGPEGTALYVHLPFCEAKCHYCDFFSVPAADWNIDSTIDAVLAEARTRAPLNPITVFIGGGTPSLLNMKQLDRFLGELDRVCRYTDSAIEVTLECNPESVSRDKIALMIDKGVTRISIGFQSLETSTLELFGRVHSVEQSFKAYADARDAGMGDINVDMIYASPGNRADDWRTALQTILDLEPDHLSAYNLAFEEDTLFSRWLRSGKLAPLPEQTELEMFDTTRELTRQRGLHAYEISNYAREGRSCRHNENYWANGAYLGIGPSAVSYLDGVRGGNPREISGYNKAIEARGQALSWSECLQPLPRLGETWWLGLRRTRGVNPEEARKAAAYEEADDPMIPIAEGLRELELLELEHGRYRMTARGVPLTDRISAEFLQPESEDQDS